MKSVISGKRLAVTGSSGFIGTNLVEHLKLNNELLAIDAVEPKLASHWQFFKNVDLRDKDDLAAQLKAFRPDAILHFGARTDLSGRTLTDYDANIEGVRNVAQVARQLDSTPVMYASSRLVFAIDHSPRHSWDYRPSTPYGASKVLGERIVRDEFSSEPWLIVRPTSIWGPHFGVPYRTFFDSVRARRYFKVQGKRPLKSFGYVGNLVYQVENLLANLSANESLQTAYWLSDFEPTDINDWSNEIAAEFDVKAPRELPYRALKVVARAGDVLAKAGTSPPLTSFRLANLLTDMVYDTSREQAICGELPYSRQRGVEITCDWVTKSQ